MLLRMRVLSHITHHVLCHPCCADMDKYAIPACPSQLTAPLLVGTCGGPLCYLAPPTSTLTSWCVRVCVFVCMWPLQHRVLQWPTLKPFIYGGKGVGAGGDGSCQVSLLAFMLHSITTVVLTPLAAGMP